MANPFQWEGLAPSTLSLEAAAATTGAGAAAGEREAAGLTAAAVLVVPKGESSKAGAGAGGGGGGRGPRRKKSMAAGGKGRAVGEDKLTSIRKSCDFCNGRKKKCDGDGVNKCSLCIQKKQETCIYSPRRPQTPRKPRKPPTRPSLGAGIRAPGTLALSNPSLKRCRISASLATGLVGTQENNLLNDFFSCMGFLPLTCQSTIRSAMVKLLISAQMSGPPELDRIVGHASGADSLVSASPAPALSSQHNDPATCMFWCAVALGGLTQGRPIDSVAGYIRLAENAMAGCLGAADADVARAWALMAYLYGFCGDAENFRKCQKKADMTLSSCRSSSGGERPADQTETAELVRHANGLCLFYGDSSSFSDVKSYMRHRAPHPQLHETATESNLCRFVMQSYQRFGQAFLSDAFNQPAQIEEECTDDAALTAPSSEDSSLGAIGYGGSGGGGTASTALAWGKGSSLDVASNGGGGSGGGGPACTVTMAGSGAMTPPAGVSNMKMMMEQAMPEYERLEETVDGSDVRGGIGGLMINCTSVVLKAVQKDLPGSVERISRCVEVLGRFPGLMRFPMGLHISHLLISALAAMDEHELFEKLRAVYNPMRPPGSVPLPPLEEWQGIGECCNHVYCRYMSPLLRSTAVIRCSVERSIEKRFQKPKQATPVPEVHQEYGAVEVGPKYIEECMEGWNTVPLPSPAPAFTVGMGEPVHVWPPHRASFSSTESDKEERDFAAAAEFSQALGAIMTPTVSTPTVMTPTVMTPTVMTPANMTPAVSTPMVRTPENMTPVSLNPANSDPTGAPYGCRTRPTAFLFDARSEKAGSVAPTTISESAGKPPLSCNIDSFDDSDEGRELLGAPEPLSTPMSTPPGTTLPFDGKFLDKRTDSGDIEGGNSIDSVADVAEDYLLAGSDEETYRGYEETVATGTFLESTLAMLHPQQTAPQPETFLFGTSL